MMTSTTPAFAGRVFLDVDDVPQALEQRFHIFDVRFLLANPSYGEEAYAKGHLPGAHYANLDKHLSGPVTAQTGRHPLPECADFVAWCRRHGLQDRRPVLCYDEECGAMAACRLWWMLHNLGVEAYVLNGGIQAYTHALHAASQAHGQAHLPALESGPAAMPNGKDDASAWPFATHFTRCYALDAIPPAATVVDCRLGFRFATTVRPYGMDGMPGHIAGAYNMPYASLFAKVASHDGEQAEYFVLKSEAELRAELQQLLHAAAPDASSFDDCVFHCGSGVSACAVIAVVHQLNMGRPFLYVGSWSEYGERCGFAIARDILGRYGFYLEMLTRTTADQPRAVPHQTPLRVNGEPCDAPDAELRAAVAHLHVGEKARVHFKSGRVALVEVPTKTAA